MSAAMNSTLQHLEPGNHRLTCPACGRNPKDRTFGVTVEHDGKVVAHCYRCEHVENHWPDCAVRYSPGKAINRSAVPLKRDSLSQYGIELFDACKAIRGTVGEHYLIARHCVVPPGDGDLRFHAALKHPASDYTGPALVALVTHAETRVPLTLQRIWIRADGRKADVESPRMLLGGHQKKHGVIRLWPEEAVTHGLCIAEGVETALSVAHDYAPVWSCVDAGNLAVMPVLDGIEMLVIAADHDESGTGTKAADACADRWSESGVDVRVIAPATEGADWNDVGCAA